MTVKEKMKIRKKIEKLLVKSDANLKTANKFFDRAVAYKNRAVDLVIKLRDEE